MAVIGMVSQLINKILSCMIGLRKITTTKIKQQEAGMSSYPTSYRMEITGAGFAPDRVTINRAQL